MVARYPRPQILEQIPHDNHTVIEASAGTGKTFTMEHLVVDLLLTERVPLESILVVTFTEKATTELQQRLRALFHRLLDTEENEDQDSLDPDKCWTLDAQARSLLTTALHTLDTAPISTIHAFCQRVLTEHAFANRRLFRQQMVDGREVFARAFRDVLRTVLACDPSCKVLLESVLEQSFTVEEMEKLLWDCLKERGALHPAVDPDAITQAAMAFPVDLLEKSRLESMLKTGNVKFQTRNATLERAPKLAALLSTFQRDQNVWKLLERLQVKYSKGETLLMQLIRSTDSATTPSPLLLQLKEAAENLERVRVPLKAAIVGMFLPPARNRLEEAKQQAGLFDFNDMLTLVARTLESSHGVSLVQALRSRYRYALIDEFQDTDELQWSIFSRVFFESGRRNIMFLVGDPKQAIYAFRGADVFTYLDACTRLNQAGGITCQLKNNFRSTPALIKVCNEILRQDAAPPFFTGPIRYLNPVEAGRPDLVAQDGAMEPVTPLHLFDVAGEGWRMGQVMDAWAERIAREIHDLLHDKPLYFGERGKTQRVQAKDIFILTGKSAEGLQVGHALRRRGVPHAFFKQDGLFQTDEAHHIRAVLAAVEDPTDRSRLLLAWNTPFFAVPLGELHGLRNLPADHEWMQIIGRWRVLAEHKQFAELFTRMLHDSGIVRRCILLDGNERAITNYQHILELLLHQAAGTRCALPELLQMLNGFIKEQKAPPGENGNVQRLESEREAVQIMTIHKSKGLEAAVVFLYGGLGRMKGGELTLLHRDNVRQAWVGKAPPPWDGAAAEEAAQGDQRLMYVTITRAKARLYLPRIHQGAIKRGFGGSFSTLNSRLHELSTASGMISVERLSKAPAFAEGTDATVPSPVLWTPPAELLQEPPETTDVDRLRYSHAGFLLTSYTQMQGSKRGYSITWEEIAAESDAEPMDGPDGGMDEALPGGKATGIFLHAVLEELDLSAINAAPSLEAWRDVPGVKESFTRLAKRHQFQDLDLARAQEVVYTAMRSRIGLADGVTMDGIASSPLVLREVDFIFPFPELQHPRLAELTHGWNKDGSQFSIHRGYIKGFIDVIFQHQGRTYVLDWKSDSMDFDTVDLQHHVDANYRIQAQLYSLAVLKMLNVHDAQEYDRRFGGVLYCFLRGMRNDGGGKRGVVVLRPNWNGIQVWENTLMNFQVAGSTSHAAGVHA